MSDIRKFDNNKGFTLVELIVVLVILAILAAILVPALLGYIDEAKNKSDLLTAKICLNAVQSGLSKQYAKGSQKLAIGGTAEKNLIISSKKGNGAVNSKGDVNATCFSNNGVPVDNDFASYVLQLISKQDTANHNSSNNDDPVVIIVGVGSNIKNSNTTLHEKYTVYYLLYVQTLDSTPFYYYNGNWSNKNPMKDKDLFTDRYTPKEGPLKGKKIQYYIISNKLMEKANNNSLGAGTDGFWNYVYNHFE